MCLMKDVYFDVRLHCFCFHLVPIPHIAMSAKDKHANELMILNLTKKKKKKQNIKYIRLFHLVWNPDAEYFV